MCQKIKRITITTHQVQHLSVFHLEISASVFSIIKHICMKHLQQSLSFTLSHCEIPKRIPDTGKVPCKNLPISPTGKGLPDERQVPVSRKSLFGTTFIIKCRDITFPHFYIKKKPVKISIETGSNYKDPLAIIKLSNQRENCNVF